MISAVRANPIIVRDLGYAAVMADPHVLCIGNFDGVHRGHQHLLAHAHHIATEHGLKLGILTFEPHPRRFFAAQGAPFRLTTPAQKMALLGDFGADFVIAQHFTADFAGLEADQFLNLLYHPQHQIRHIIVGADFCFGRQRKGTIALLKARAAQHGCTVHIHDLLAADGIISSSRIREHLAQGQIAAANDLLGRAWCLDGQVQQGRQLARTLGFPTANIALGDYLCPAKGVYAITAHIGHDGPHDIQGVANIGLRPTVNSTTPNDQAILLEAHLFDCDADLYGRHIRVQLLHFLRPEQKFTSIELLRQQIVTDVAQAQKWFIERQETS